MAALGDDCYFFCTSTCAKGASCPFRHVEAAKTCRIICQHWQMGGCLRPMCKFRHSDFMLQLDTSEVPCYWDSQPTGCVKKNCVYKHSKPRPQDDVTAAATGSVPVDNSNVGTQSTKNEVITPQNFVQPVVTPVIIQPLAESEESNSSPMKRSLEAAQELKVQVDPKRQEIEPSASESSEVNNDSIYHTTQEQTIKKKKKKIAPVKKVKQYKTAQNAVEKKIVQKVPGKIKAKSKKNLEPPQKSVKGRLGKAPFLEPAAYSPSAASDSDSNSDSDDSIENIKVMSMEEIFRQKALESMMKKRVTEGKTSAEKKLISTAGKKSSSTDHRIPPPAKRLDKYANTVKKVKHIPAPVESSSASSEEGSSDEEVTPKQSTEKSSTSSSDTSSSSSSSDSEEDSANDSEELDVRRVVVDLESEKAARKKAKASFLKKQKLNAANTKDNKNKGQVLRTTARKVNHASSGALSKLESRGKQQRKRHIDINFDIDYDSDNIVSSRVKAPLKLNVRDRLGKSAVLHKASSDARLGSRTEKFRSVVGVTKHVVTKKEDTSLVPPKISKSSSSSEDDLADVKVKTLEEIRLEKLRKQDAEESKRKVSSRDNATGKHKSLSVKQRLGIVPDNKQNKEGENLKSRQVVLVNDNGCKSDDASNMKTLDEQKKAKRRPWRSQRRFADPSSVDIIAGDGGERTAVFATQSAMEDDYTSELNSYKDEQDTEESPFERLRRKALMKKLQSRKIKQPALTEEVNTEETASGTQEKGQVVEEDDAGDKTHKHKHNHKHHKKVKKERQIYMPPAMKSTATVSEPENLSPKRELVLAPTATQSPQKRGPHPIAAAWTAGLTLSSKGLAVRRTEPTPAFESSRKFDVGARLAVRETTITPKEIIPTSRPKEIISSKSKEIILFTRPKETVPYTKPKEVISASEAPQSSVDTAGVTIKSFSEIMAEKRKRRLEMQVQKSGIPDSTASTYLSTEPSALPLSAAAASTINVSNITSSKPVDVKPRVPILPIVFSTDKSSDMAVKSMMQTNSPTVTVVKVTGQPTAVTFQTSPDVSNFTGTTAPSQTLILNSTTRFADNVNLKSMKSSKNSIDNKKNVKKLFTKKNSKEQSDCSSVFISGDSNSKIPSSSLHSHNSTSSTSETVTSITANTSQDTHSHHMESSKSSYEAQSTHLSSGSKASPAQPLLSATSTDVSAKPSVPKLSTIADIPGVKPSPALTKRQSVPTLAVDKEPSKKRARLSVIEDEFNFFEDEDLGIDDVLIPENVQQIDDDDLLQDIDDLLS